MSLALLKNSLLIFLALCITNCTLKSKAKTPTKLFLASSLLPLKKSLETLAPSEWDLELVFLSSSLIAQQAANGVACDGLILADQQWLDYLMRKQPDRFTYPRVMATNKLVLAAAKPLRNNNFINIIKSLKGPRQLIIGDPGFVPLGRYSEQALRSMNLWDSVKDKLLTAHSAHNARVLLEKSMAPYAILFQSDISALGPLYQIAEIDTNLHKPVQYFYLSCQKSAQADAVKSFLFSAEFQGELAKLNFGLPHGP
jgi:molybdate transport system substrate-binding protein